MKQYLRRTLAATLVAALLISPAAALTAQEALDLLDAYYLDGVPTASRDMETAAEILSSLGDPYTYYMPAVTYESFLESVDGETVVGIGVQIHQVADKGIEIISILPDSPALEAGLVGGDCILEVDGIALTSIDLASELIAGEEGTTVTVKISHADGSTHTYTLERREVAIPIVTYDTVDSVPFIDCTSFGSSTADTVREAMVEYADWGGSVVMDLRSNPGGTDTASAGTAGIFVGGQTIAYYMNGSNQVSRLYTVSSTVDYTDEPVIILTSGYSASGSEMFAGAIRSYSAGIAIGSRTYGKGIAQIVVDEDSYPEIFDGDSLKITTSRFYAPDGATNDTVGVIPTLTIDDALVEDVAVLLATPEPSDTEGYLQLILGGSAFYIDCDQATSDTYLPAFQELLSAITPNQTVSVGYLGRWVNMGVDATASMLGVTYTSRYYTDVSGTYADALNTLATHDLLNIASGGDYLPDETMTRGEFAYMVAYALQLRTVAGNPFADVADDDENLAGIAALYAKGMVSGYEDGTFRPDEAITGTEAMTILANAAQWVNRNAKIAQLTDGFTDEELARYDQFPTWAQKSVATLDFIDSLVTSITPDETIQRDEAGAMIYELLEGAGLLWD